MPVSFDGFNFINDLVVLVMYDFTIISGIDWMIIYRVQLDCFTKILTFSLPGLYSVIETSKGNPFDEPSLPHIGGKDVLVELVDRPVVYEFHNIFANIPRLHQPES